MSEKINTALEWGQSQFSHISDSPKLDAELLLAFCCDKPRSFLYTWPEQELSVETWHCFQALVSKRLAPTPVAYLLGEREFFSLSFKTTSSALVPRPETELLVETALDLCPPGSELRILELGTGTGAIPISLKTQRPDICMVATDISPACLDLAQQNAERHKVAIDWIESDWFSAIESAQTFDMIVSNPPYIAANNPYLTRGDLPAEPMLALSPGETGLESIAQIVASSPDYLKPGGYLLLEHGYDQQSEVARLMRIYGFVQINCKQDANHQPRVSMGQLG
ncbi:MAG: release factor glutamine methyltransferase [Gammaproteobacteria bacterium]|jgi:release factor glutamine methyltransferase